MSFLLLIDGILQGHGLVVHFHLIINTAEDVHNGWLQVVKEDPLCPRLEVLHHCIDGRGCGVVRSVDVTAVDDHGDVVLQTLLVHNVTHVIDGWEDKASVWRYHQVLGADGGLRGGERGR